MFELFVNYFFEDAVSILAVYQYYFGSHKLVILGADWIRINKEF